jgi:Ca2+-binding EF-hand superfamily protein
VIFNSIDENKDGKISQSEFIDAFKELALNVDD